MLCTLTAQESFVLKQFGSDTPVCYGGKRSDENVTLPVDYVPKKNEFRGVWIATIESIDFGKHDTAKSFRDDFKEVIANLKKNGFNAVIFQVRPMNDAFYPSKFNPLSKWMTGKEGGKFTDEPDFDPLNFMVALTHARGMEFHAWLNPYRVTSRTPLSKEEYLKTLSPENFAAKNPQLVLEAPVNKKDRLLILDPGSVEVQMFLLNSIREIVKNYDVDAIHLDDYFYPYTDIGEADDETYQKNGKNTPRDEWRRGNVDTLIRDIHSLLESYSKKKEKKIRFGISPFGIWANAPDPVEERNAAKLKKEIKSHPDGSLSAGSQSYFTQYADTRKWVKENWIDYIVPQLYWGFSHQTAPYAALTDWWAEQVTGTKCTLYTGNGFYRLGGSNPDWKNPDEILNQLLFNQTKQEVAGAAFFSYIRLFKPDNPAQKKAAEKLLRLFRENKVPSGQE